MWRDCKVAAREHHTEAQAQQVASLYPRKYRAHVSTPGITEKISRMAARESHKEAQAQQVP